MPQPFRCPICRCTQYQTVGNTRNGKPVFACHSCSVLFSDPERFTKFEPHASPDVKPDLKKNWRQRAAEAVESGLAHRAVQQSTLLSFLARKGFGDA